MIETFIDIRKLKSLYNTDYEIQELKQFDKNMVINDLKAVKFCPQNILEYSEKTDKCFEIKSENVSIITLYWKTLEVPIIKIIKSLKQVIALKKYFKLDKKFTIYFIASPFKRFMPKDGFITSNNINGGFTTRNGNDIYILRIEEFSKVILHEVIHHCDKIDINNWSNENIKLLKTKFNISNDTDLFPNEAIVELWATIFNCIFLSIDYKISIQHLLNVEIKHSIYQANKLLKMQKNNQWRENTNAYCYVVFKTILLYNLNKLGIYPYNINYITNFLIKNTFPILNIKFFNNELRILKLSDY